MTGFLFGKLPAHGDFVARGLAPAARHAMDAWLSGALEIASEAHGEAFADLYGSAPPWRFATSDGAGALACSVDAVGRRFPVIAGCTAAGDPAAAAAACEEALYEALAGQWDADRLLAGADAAEKAAGDGAPVLGWWTAGGFGFAPAAQAGDRPVGLLRAMLTPEPA